MSKKYVIQFCNVSGEVLLVRPLSLLQHRRCGISCTHASMIMMVMTLTSLLFLDDFLGGQRIFLTCLGMFQLFGIEVFNARNKIILLLFLFDG